MSSPIGLCLICWFSSGENKAAESNVEGDHGHYHLVSISTSGFIHDYCGGWPSLSLAVNPWSKSRRPEVLCLKVL